MRLKPGLSLGLQFFIGERNLTREIIVSFVIFVQHSRRDVGYISARITLTSHVDLKVLDAKGSLKVLEEMDEVLGDFFLARSCDFSDRESSADRLFNPSRKVSDLYRAFPKPLAFAWLLRTIAYWSG